MPPEDNPADDVQPTREEWDAYEERERRVFTNCNVCGIPLRTFEEEQMGMCDRCAEE